MRFVPQKCPPWTSTLFVNKTPPPLQCPSPSPSPSFPLGTHGVGVRGCWQQSPASRHCHPPSGWHFLSTSRRKWHFHFLLHLAFPHALCYLRISVGPWAPRVASCRPALSHMLPSAWNPLASTAHLADSISPSHSAQGPSPPGSPP